MSVPHGNGALRVRGTKSLSDATIFTTFPEVGSALEARALQWQSAARLTRYGMDCYHALLAAGQIDLVIEAGLNAYDIQAPIALIQAAGGVVTDWTGGAAHMGGRVVAAATPELHAEAMSILKEVTQECQNMDHQKCPHNLTMDDTRRELNGHDILLRDGVIAEIGESLSIP